MTTPVTVPDDLAPLARPPATGPLPLLYEAEEEDLGEAKPHYLSGVILALGLATHLASRPQYEVFANLNCYYGTGSPPPSFTPDVMVALPTRDLGEDVSSYSLLTDGPAPRLVIEILSESTAEERDLNVKIALYAQLGIAEYILMDRWGRWLPQRLLLKRLQTDGTYRDERDADGGVTSALGFRLVFAEDGWPDVINVATGHRYARPTQAEQEAEGRRLAELRQRHAEEQARQEAELRRQAEEKQREEAEARRQAEEKQREEAEARRQAEEKQREEAEARRRAEEKQSLAEEKQHRAETKQRRADEKRRRAEEKQRQAEEQIKTLQAEVERLRQAAAEQPPPADDPQP